MKNRYFKDENITANDVLFACSMIERIARKIHRRNRDVVNAICAEGLAHELSCATAIPTPVQMGGVYQRLVRDTAAPGEDESEGILRVYNHPICDIIDDYNASAYYEPSYWLAAGYRNGSL